VLVERGATGLGTVGAGTGALDAQGTGLGQGGDDGTGTGVEDAGAPDAESSVAEPRWPVADDRVSPAPPRSRAATGSPIQVAACKRDIVISTSTSAGRGWPGVSGCTCGRAMWLHSGAKNPSDICDDQ